TLPGPAPAGAARGAADPRGAARLVPGSLRPAGHRGLEAAAGAGAGGDHVRHRLAARRRPGRSAAAGRAARALPPARRGHLVLAGPQPRDLDGARLRGRLLGALLLAAVLAAAVRRQRRGLPGSGPAAPLPAAALG